MKRVIVLFLAVVMLVSFTSCVEPFVYEEVKGMNLMEGLKENKVQGKDADERFIASTASFSIDLFKRSVGEENSLISPLSVLLAMAMTANGANKNTLKQMEEVLGGDISIDELNEYLYAYVKSLPNKETSKLVISNSIWFRDDESRFAVNKAFLQKNADYYKANAYKSPFDEQTLKDINSWVKQKTDGMIEKILEQIDPNAVMFLINAIVFDAEWEVIYNENMIYEREFTNFDGTKSVVEMMQSEEAKFISDGKAKGFVKPYKGGDYSFAAILPESGVSVYDYIADLDGESFLNLLKGARNVPVHAAVPKFSYDFTIKMNDALKDMGIVDAFDAASADLSRLGRSSRGNLFISEVLHKTFISVDEKGTKAGAVTKVEVRDESGFMGKIVVLDRPFVYAIIDNATNLPVFVGAVVNLSN